MSNCFNNQIRTKVNQPYTYLLSLKSEIFKRLFTVLTLNFKMIEKPNSSTSLLVLDLFLKNNRIYNSFQEELLKNLKP